eukprot:Rmarinus@m.27921
MAMSFDEGDVLQQMLDSANEHGGILHCETIRDGDGNSDGECDGEEDEYVAALPEISNGLITDPTVSQFFNRHKSTVRAPRSSFKLTHDFLSSFAEEEEEEVDPVVVEDAGPKYDYDYLLNDHDDFVLEISYEEYKKFLAETLAGDYEQYPCDDEDTDAVIKDLVANIDCSVHGAPEDEHHGDQHAAQRQRRQKHVDRLRLAESQEQERARQGNYDLLAAEYRSMAQRNQYIRLTRRDQLSAKLTEDAVRRDAGLPTACAFHPKLIVVGTSHGLMLIFDHFQQLKTILGSAQGEYGSVTSVDVSGSGDWIVCGHSKGAVVLWDMMNGQPLKTVTDAHSQSVLHAKFTEKQNLIITADLQGVVNFISYNKMFLVILASVTRCLQLDGPVMAMAMMRGYASRNNAPAVPSIVAIAGPRVVAVAVPDQSPTPSNQDWAMLSRPPGVREGALPYLALAKASQTESGTMMCVCWGTTLLIYRVEVITVEDNRKRVKFRSLWSEDVDTEITGVSWVGTRALACLTARDELILLSIGLCSARTANETGSEAGSGVGSAVDSGVGSAVGGKEFLVTELERLDVKDVGLLYHTYFQGDSGSPELAFYQAFHSCSDTLYVVGLESLYVAPLMTFKQRIDVLVDKGEWLSAMALTLDFYHGHGLNAIASDMRPGAAAREVASQKLVELLTVYINLSMASAKAALGAASVVGVKTDDAATPFKTLAALAIDYCVTINRLDLLFYDLHAKFREGGQEAAFLTQLEPYILHDKLTHLAPEVMQSFVNYYQENNWLARVEQCILKMNIPSLDFQQVVKLCRKHHLYSALIYVFNTGCNDYIIPLEDLFDAVSSEKKSGAGKDVSLLSTGVGSDEKGSDSHGYKLLLYVSYCLKGQAFPSGLIQPDQYPVVRAEILRFLFEKGDAKHPYARIRTMIKIDAKDFFDVITPAFDDPPVPPAGVDISKLACPSRQELFSILASLIVPNDELIYGAGAHREAENATGQKVSPVRPDAPKTASFLRDNYEFSSLAIDAFFKFTASSLIRGRISCDQEMIHKLLFFFTVGIAFELDQLMVQSNEGVARGREQLLVDILHVLPAGSFNENRFLPVMERNGFYSAALFLYKRRKNPQKIVECYLNVKGEEAGVFNYVDFVMRSAETAEQTKADIKRIILSKLDCLISVDPERTAALVLQHFRDDNESVLQGLESNPQLQYLYLKAVMNSDAAQEAVEDDHEEPTHSHTRDRSGSSSDEDNPMRNGNGSSNMIRITWPMRELYIRRMCQFEPSKVYSFLISATGYQLDACLKICQEEEIMDATAHLLERTGDIAGALKLLRGALNKDIQHLRHCMETRAEASQAAAPTPGQTMGKKKPMGRGWLSFKKALKDGRVTPNVASSRPSARKLKQLSAAVAKATEILGDALRKLHQTLEVSLGICQRNHNMLDGAEAEGLWFEVLETFVIPLRELWNRQESHNLHFHLAATGQGAKSHRAAARRSMFRPDAALHFRGPEEKETTARLADRDFRAVLDACIHRILHCMATYVTMTSIVQRIMSSHASDQLGVFKITLTNMLGAAQYEENLLQATNKILEVDSYKTALRLYGRRARAYAPSAELTCDSCRTKLSTSQTGSMAVLPAVVFACGHSFHERCLPADSHSCPTCSQRSASGGATDWKDNEHVRRESRLGMSPYARRLKMFESQLDERVSAVEEDPSTAGDTDALNDLDVLVHEFESKGYPSRRRSRAPEEVIKIENNAMPHKPQRLRVFSEDHI